MGIFSIESNTDEMEALRLEIEEDTINHKNKRLIQKKELLLFMLITYRAEQIMKRKADFIALLSTILALLLWGFVQYKDDVNLNYWYLLLPALMTTFLIISIYTTIKMKPIKIDILELKQEIYKK